MAGSYFKREMCRLPSFSTNMEGATRAFSRKYKSEKFESVNFGLIRSQYGLSHYFVVISALNRFTRSRADAARATMNIIGSLRGTGS